MFKFHQHNWIETERFYAPPAVMGACEISGMSPNDMVKLKVGQTTIIYQCKNCGEIKTIQIFGQPINPKEMI